MTVTALNNPWINNVFVPILSTEVQKELRKRSGGTCERCYNQPATEEAPTLRRWEMTDHPAVQDLVHLCPACLGYCENTHAGRMFMVQFRQLRWEGMK